MAEFEQVLRVQMDEQQLQFHLKPILNEINALRARVKYLEDRLVDDGK